MRIEYDLTSKRRDLAEVVAALSRWVERWSPDPAPSDPAGKPHPCGPLGVRDDLGGQHRVQPHEVGDDQQQV
ncbi:MAG: hypothetical protein ACYCXA_15190, partial [Actinomycetes bacterium]